MNGTQTKNTPEHTGGIGKPEQRVVPLNDFDCDAAETVQQESCSLLAKKREKERKRERERNQIFAAYSPHFTIHCQNREREGVIPP